MPIRYKTTIVSCLALLSGCGGDTGQEDGLSQAAASEWIILFNGEDLHGWRSYGEAAPGHAWIVEDGAIVLDADEGTSSMTGGDLNFVAFVSMLGRISNGFAG